MCKLQEEAMARAGELPGVPQSDELATLTVEGEPFWTRDADGGLHLHGGKFTIGAAAVPSASAVSDVETLRTIIATKAGEIAALTAEVTHLAEKLAERDAKVGGSVGDDLNFYRLLNAARDAYKTAEVDGAYQELIDYLDSRSASAASVDRNSVLEEAALACEAWGDAKVIKWQDSPDMLEDAKSRAWDGLQCAHAIRALKSAAPQPVDAAQAVPEVQLLDALIEKAMDLPKSLATRTIALAPTQIAWIVANYKAAAPSPAAQPAAQEAVPEGFVLVPIKPTDDMCDAPDVRIGGCYSCSAQLPSWGEHAKIYAAMLAAAPVAQPTDTTKAA